MKSASLLLLFACCISGCQHQSNQRSMLHIPPGMESSLSETPVRIEPGTQLASERDERLFVSCQNHRAQLNFDLRMDFHEKAAPPHEADVPGYVMLARYAAQKPGGLNCNHGAPGSLIGGWQAVNLTPEQWLGLSRMWIGRGHQEQLLPFYWCGKPNPLQKRVFCSIWRDAEGGWFIDHRVLPEAEVRDAIGKLNACLSDLGLPLVAVDIPDGVEWDAFERERKR